MFILDGQCPTHNFLYKCEINKEAICMKITLFQVFLRFQK